MSAECVRLVGLRKQGRRACHGGQSNALPDLLISLFKTRPLDIAHQFRCAQGLITFPPESPRHVAHWHLHTIWKPEAEPLSDLESKRLVQRLTGQGRHQS